MSSCSKDPEFCLMPNGQPFPSLLSRDKPVQNADGSTNFYLGPKPPEGKAGNCLATGPGKGYFAILRLSAPSFVALFSIEIPLPFALSMI
jgi:hypothetical protein